MKSLLLLLAYFLFFAFSSFSQEICDNGIDDDMDGLIDMNDVLDCSCSGFDTTVLAGLIPNASFEDNVCCPSSYSELYCADSWIQASDATSDYMNTCGFIFPAAIAAGLVPFPDGNGVVGAIFANLFGSDYLEYIGACLNSTMLTGQPYTVEFYVASTAIDPYGDPCPDGIFFGDIDLTLYGNSNCAAIPWFGQDCPTAANGWQVLGTITYTPQEVWTQVQMSFIPSQDINVVALGGPCTLPSDYSESASGCYPYFYFDDLNLVSSTGEVEITYNQSNCEYGELTATIDTTGGSWQWYLDGVALVGQTDSVLDLNANSLEGGDYWAVYTAGLNCASSIYTVPSIGPDTTTLVETVCEFYYWSEIDDTLTLSGIYEEVLQNQFGCDSTIELTLTVNNHTSLTIDTTICLGESVNFFNVEYNSTGLYFDTITNASLCDSTLELNLLVVDKPEAPELSMSQPNCSSLGITLTGQTEPGNTILWYGPNGFLGVNSSQTIQQTQGNIGTYAAMASNQGCLSDSAYIDVLFEPTTGLTFEVPNVITCNKDGVNEILDVQEFYPGCDFEFVIVNRWGNNVFTQTKGSAPFNGYDKNGKELSEGSYFYKLTVEGAVKHGFIQLLR